MKENIKTFKIITKDGDITGKHLMHVCDGINAAKMENMDGSVSPAYYITWHLDKKHPTKQLCYFVLGTGTTVWFEKTNMWYNMNNPKEFEKLHHDIEVACVMANLED